ncbi:unnamed protein product, partial [Darwinula stevensoni]
PESRPSPTETEESPSVYLRDGSALPDATEVRTPSPERALAYVDYALKTLSTAAWRQHLLVTLHVYQYSLVESKGPGKNVSVIGGRTRLHVLHVGGGRPGVGAGPCPALPQSGAAHVLVAVFNGARHLPYK